MRHNYYVWVDERGIPRKKGGVRWKRYAKLMYILYRSVGIRVKCGSRETTVKQWGYSAVTGYPNNFVRITKKDGTHVQGGSNKSIEIRSSRGLMLQKGPAPGRRGLPR